MTSTRKTAPRFCPRCRRVARDDRPLCVDCGEATAPQGYCAVCERFLALPAGAACPKHEVALDDAPPRRDPAVGPADWVTVGAFAHPIEAAARQIRLEAEGIPTFLDGSRMGLNTLYQVATGGIKLQVPAPMVAEARVVLAQSWAAGPRPEGDAAADVDADLDEAWDDLAPAPGTAPALEQVAWGLILFPGAVLVLVAALLVLRAFRT